jgi:hypothetical protein
MKTKVILILGITTLILALISACGSNNSNPLGGCNGLSYAEAFQGDQYQDLLDATSTFGEEQTAQSCEVYKSELQDWYGVLQGLSSDCIAVPQEQYQQSLAEAQESIDEIDCSQYESN